MNNFKNVKKRLGIIALVFFYSLTSNTAQAGDIVTQWNFDTWADFTGATYEGVGGGTTFTGPHELSWGVDGADFTTAGTGRSGLTIGTGVMGGDRFGGGNVLGFINTIIGGVPGPNQAAKGISATHWNNPLTAPVDSLLSGILTDNLTLEAVLPNGGPVQAAPQIAIDFKFQETPNAGTNGVCLDGSAPPAAGCPDIFGFEGSAALGIPFNYDGNEYGLNILVFDANGGSAPFQTLDDGYCSALGLNNGCSGLVTPESAFTSFQFGFNISHVGVSTVPEPSSLVLLAGAMMLFGAKKRKFNILK